MYDSTHTARMNSSFRFLRYWGNSSTMAVMKPSMVQNWESRPRKSNMKKKQQDQKGEKGIWRTALG